MINEDEVCCSFLDDILELEKNVKSFFEKKNLIVYYGSYLFHSSQIFKNRVVTAVNIYYYKFKKLPTEKEFESMVKHIKKIYYKHAPYWERFHINMNKIDDL